MLCDGCCLSPVMEHLEGPGCCQMPIIKGEEDKLALHVGSELSQGNGRGWEGRGPGTLGLLGRCAESKDTGGLSPWWMVKEVTTEDAHFTRQHLAGAYLLHTISFIHPTMKDL